MDQRSEMMAMRYQMMGEVIFEYLNSDQMGLSIMSMSNVMMVIR